MGLSCHCIRYNSSVIDINGVERRRPTTAQAGCCSLIYKRDGIFARTKKIRGLNEQGGTSSFFHTDVPFKAEIIIDSRSNPKTIYVNTRMKIINSTANTDLHRHNRHITDESVRILTSNLINSIKRFWNNTYRLRIEDKKCGERIFDVEFNPIFTDYRPHYKVNCVNVLDNSNINPLAEYFRSIVLGIDLKYISKFEMTLNLGVHNLETVFSHEYGHIVGNADEYPEDNRLFVRYEHLNGREEIHYMPLELMGDWTASGAYARPKRYVLPVGYAVVKVLRHFGVEVTDMEPMSRNDPDEFRNLIHDKW
ncbi:MAG: hypothetical protein M9924_19765 [Rhizobiaceae bacterium]|nr:hypothetical protein [Rhizobiaceae bacterium]